MRHRAFGTAAFLVVTATPLFGEAHFGDGLAPAEREGALGTRSPRFGVEPDPEPLDPREVPLFPRVPLARAAGWILPPEPTPSDREDEGEAALERYFDGALGEDRLEAGEVDGWYREAGRAMRHAFRPDSEEIRAERTAGMSLLQQAFDEFRRYAEGPEPPRGPNMLPELRAAVPHPGDRQAVMEQEHLEWCNPLNGRTTWYRVDLRVTHNPEGALSASWVLRSSGIGALDRAALHAVRTGGVHLPPPPPRVVGDRQAVRSDWAFEMGDVAVPPGCPSLSCLEDPVQGWICGGFGRGLIRTRVWLLTVVDAQHPTPEERRAARRADPDRARP